MAIPAPPLESSPATRAAADPAKTRASLRRTDFGPWHLSLWLLHRRLVQRQARYHVVQVDVDDGLQASLRAALLAKLQGPQADALELAPYAFASDDQDRRVLALDAADTDFPQIQAEVDQGLANRKAEQFEELQGAWAYVVKLEHAERAVYGLRKISQYARTTRLAASGALSYLLFRDKQLSDLGDAQVLTLDLQIDFVAAGGVLFIYDKQQFESALNFRARMEGISEQVLEELGSSRLLSDVEPIRRAVGDNLHHLRKMAAIQNSGYYKDAAFMAGLLEQNEARRWGLKVEDGVIVVQEQQVELLLKLLNNDRLESPINHEVFDAAVKTRVTRVTRVTRD